MKKHLCIGLSVVMNLMPLGCGLEAAITAAGITGPAVISPGGTATFNYQLAGQDSVTSTTPVVIYLSSVTTAPAGGSSERIGGFSAPLVFQGTIGGTFPVYKAPTGASPSPQQTIPAELSHSSWPVTVRFKGTIPPGNYFVVLNVANTYASYAVTVQPMTITSFTPATEAVGQTIQISGANLDRATQVFIAGTEVFTTNWSYNSTNGRITATVPNTATNTGKVEVRNLVQTATSTTDFTLKLPDFSLPVNPAWGAAYLINHQPSATTTGSIRTGANSYLSVIVKNIGAVPTASFSVASVAVDSSLVTLVGISSPMAINGQQNLTFTLPSLSAGTHTVTVRADDSSVIREANETNNTLSFSLTVTAHPVDAWRATYFAPATLADPAKEATDYGDAADPDHDGRANLVEFIRGTSPISAADAAPSPPFGIWPGQLPGGSLPMVSFFRAASAAQVRLILQASATLAGNSWSTLTPGIDYTEQSVAVTGGRRIEWQLLGTQTAPTFLRLGVERTY